jgi:hypothetical protein
MILGVLAGLIAGCATPRIDWNARVGHYTHDQAILELGPPDKAAVLTDGTLVAEWFTGRRGPTGTVGFGFGTGYRRMGTGIGVMHPVHPGYFELLRLTFDPEGTLVSWQRYTR